MAQLRDSTTSELLAEGTPLDVVLIADELGRDDVLFDDVGQDFDPDAVRAGAEENAAGLEGAAAKATGAEAKRLAAAAKAAAAELELDPAAVAEARRCQEEARARLEGG